MTLTADARECTDQLARFFPKLPAVRIAVKVTPRRPGQVSIQEATVVEYGTREYAIFLSKLALEFDDRVRLVREGGDIRQRPRLSPCSITKDAKRWRFDFWMTPANG